MRIPLTGGAYQGRSVIASAQRCINLYPETNPPESQMPVPVTHYPTPGLTRLATPPAAGRTRCLYTASNGIVYSVVGAKVYRISLDFVYTLIGTINDGQQPVSMIDNGLAIVIVDGSSMGWAIDMIAGTFGAISGAAFYGASHVTYKDTYFVFNRPETSQWYISLSLVSYAMLVGGTAFDALDIASKSSRADNLAGLIGIGAELWLVGTKTTEIWYNSGAADFTFAKLPNGDINHGCAAAYSIAKTDKYGFWLSQDESGYGIVVQTQGYDITRISTHAIEAEIQSYATIYDAVGFCFHQQGHGFYVLTFPTQNVTWAFEIASKQWHQLAYTDTNGVLNRHRAAAHCFGYNKNLVADWQNGKLYELDPDAFTDDGAPITRIRTFPHLVQDSARVSYLQFVADMQVGTLLSNDPDSFVSLRWSDTRGASWGSPLLQTLGRTGEYSTVTSWGRLGMARDRVFELSWSCPVKTALNGAFIDVVKHNS